MHWLTGTDPSGAMYARWREVFDIGKLTFVYPEEFVRLETEHGEFLTIYANVDRMEMELINRAPQDEAEIRRLSGAVRRLAKFAMPLPGESWPRRWMAIRTFITLKTAAEAFCCHSASTV